MNDVTYYTTIQLYIGYTTNNDPRTDVYDQPMATKRKAKLELTDPLIEVVAERFKVLGEPMRVKLLSELRYSELTVGELQAATGGTQQNVSKHLGILHHAGMVDRRKEGNLTRYRINDPSVFELCELVCNGMQRQVDQLGSILRGQAA